MKAFKFRSASQIEFALDILLNRRLYCSDWRRLNDPMEGLFAYSTTSNEPYIQQLIKGIGEAKAAYKVCSLSADFQSHLLWSHYAGGFDGLAIEVDLPSNHRMVRKIEYRGVFAFLNMDEIHDEDEAARIILFSKYQEWSYEKEIRILSTDEWFELERPVRRVIAGHRMNQALFKTLGIVCEREGIELCKVGIGDEGIDADRVYPEDFERSHRRARRRR